MSQHTSIEALASVIMEAGAQAIGAAAAVAWLFDESGGTKLLASTGLSEELSASLPPAAALPVALAMKTGGEAFHPTRASVLRDFPGVPLPGDLHAAAALPLSVRSRVLGVLAFSFSSEHSFTPDEREFLRTLATLCALGLERSSLIQAAARATATAERERPLLRSPVGEARRAGGAETILQQLVESIPVIAWGTDAAGNINYYNHRWYEYTGLPAGSLSQEDWVRSIHPDDLPAVGARWATDLARGRPFEAELRLRRAADDSYRWHLARSVPVKDADGRVARWFGVSVDVEDVKRAADEHSALLQRAEAASSEAKAQREWLQSILMQAPVAIALYRGPNHVIELANPLMCRIWGRSSDRLLGKSVAEALPEMAAQGIIKVALDPVFATGTPYFANEMPVRIDRAGDGVFAEGAYNFVHVPLLGPRGDTEGIVAVASEVTEQMFSRKRIETLAQKLSESEEQFRTLANSIPQLAWIAEPNGDIHWYNQRWFNYTGTTLAEMEDESGWGWKKVHDPAELPRVIAQFQSAIASGEPWEDTFPLRRRDGEFRWHLSRAMPVRDAQGRIVRWFGTNTDVEDSRQQAAALQVAIATRDDFLSVAGHELRTPLAAMLLHIQGSARTLRKEAGSPRILERLEKAAEAGLRLEGLVNKLLDVSRIQAGRLALELEPVDLAALVKEVVQRHSEEALARGMSIGVEAPDQLVGTWDKTRLDQVVTNLLGNAIKYGDHKPIELTLSGDGARAVLRVADHGIGIAREAQDRIFQRFERAALSTDYGGIGLGLWITRQIVEALGGNIEVRSNPRDGSAFTVTLPLRPMETPVAST